MAPKKGSNTSVTVTATLEKIEDLRRQHQDVADKARVVALLAEAAQAICALTDSITGHTEDMAKIAKAKWFSLDLESRLALVRFSEEAVRDRPLDDDLGMFKILHPKFRKMYQKAWAHYHKAALRFRSAVEEKLEAEGQATAALKSSMEAQARFLEGHLRGKQAIEAGDYDTYDLDELEKQFG